MSDLRPYKHTPETIERIRAASTGRVKSQQTRQTLSAAGKLRAVPAGQIERLAAINRVDWTDRMMQLARDGLNAGRTPAAVARDLKIDRKTLVRWAAANGVTLPAPKPLPGTGFTPQRIAYIRAAYPGGMLTPAILVSINEMPGRQLTLRMLTHFIQRSPDIRRDRDVAIRAAAEGKRAACALKVSGRVSAAPLPPRRFTYTAPTRDVPVRIAVPGEPVVLPAPNAEGVVEARLGDLMVWCVQNKIEGVVEARLGDLMVWCVQNKIEGFDGRQVEALCKIRARMGLPRVLVSWV